MHLYHGLHSNAALRSQLYGCGNALDQELVSSQQNQTCRPQMPRLQQQQHDIATGVSASINFLSTFLDDSVVELDKFDEDVLDSSRHTVGVVLMDELLKALQDEAQAGEVTTAVPAAACCPASFVQNCGQHKVQGVMQPPDAIASAGECSYCNSRATLQSAVAVPAPIQPAVASTSPPAQYNSREATFSQEQLQKIIDEEMQLIAQPPAAAPVMRAVLQQSQPHQRHQYQLSAQVCQSVQVSQALLPGGSMPSPGILLSPVTDSACTGSRPRLEDSVLSVTVASSAASNNSSGVLPAQCVLTAKPMTPKGACISAPCNPYACNQGGAVCVGASSCAAAAADQPAAASSDMISQYNNSLMEQWQQQHNALGSVVHTETGLSAGASGAAAAQSPFANHAVPEVAAQRQFTDPSSSCYTSTMQQCSSTPGNQSVPSTSNKQQCLRELKRLQQLREEGHEQPCLTSAGSALQRVLLDQLQVQQPIYHGNSVQCDVAAGQQLQQSNSLWSSIGTNASTDQLLSQLLMQYSESQVQHQQHMMRANSPPCNLAALQQQAMPLVVHAERPISSQLHCGLAGKARNLRRTSSEQRRSFEHRLFKVRRPLQAAPAAPTPAVSLAISDRVKARIQWQHQQRQLERKVRQQYQQPVDGLWGAV